MSDPTPRTRRGYDRLAAVYEPLAAGLSCGAIPRSRRRLLARAARGARRALVVGGGPGTSLLALLDSGFEGRVVHLEPSPAMQRRARVRLRRDRPASVERVAWVVGGVEALAADASFDLLCTHFVLDQFESVELAGVVGRLADCAAPGARWHDVDFESPGRLGALAVPQRLLLAGLYLGFGVACGLAPRSLPPIEAAIRATGFRLDSAASGAGGALRSSLFRSARSPDGDPAPVARGRGLGHHGTSGAGR